jgi:hypothetical protein
MNGVGGICMLLVSATRAAVVINRILFWSALNVIG